MCRKVSGVQRHADVPRTYLFLSWGYFVFISLDFFPFRWTCLCSRSYIPWVVEISRCFYFTIHAEDNFSEQHPYKIISFYLSGPFLSSRKHKPLF